MIFLNSNLFLTTYSFLLSYVGILNGDTSDRKSHLGVIKVYRFTLQFDTSPDCIDREDRLSLMSWKRTLSESKKRDQRLALKILDHKGPHQLGHLTNKVRCGIHFPVF